MSAPIPGPGRVGGTSTVPAELVHTVCCDPDVALCATRVPGSGWVSTQVDPAEACVVCESLDAWRVTCGRRLCRLRQWLRRTITDRRPL